MTHKMMAWRTALIIPYKIPDNVMLDCVRRRKNQVPACRYMKCSVFGNKGCGKTSLLAKFQDNSYNEHCQSTEVNEQYSRDIQIDRQDISLDIWDTGTSSLMQHQAYNVHMILICFSVDDPASLKAVTDHWFEEAKHFADNDVPIMLVGLKTDVRNNEEHPGDLVSRCEAEDIAHKIGKFGYMETSAKSGVGISELFDIVVKEALHKPQKATCCTLL